MNVSQVVLQLLKIICKRVFPITEHNSAKMILRRR